MQRLRFVIGVVVLAVWLGVLAGCDHGLYSLLTPAPQGDSGSGGTSTTSTGEGGDLFTGSGGAGGAPPPCDGVCAGIGPDGFEENPSMMWFGTPADAPEACPDFAPLVGFEGFADLHVAPHTCAACSCSPASCALPEAMHASAAMCPGDGAASLPFDAPAAWEGACTAEDAIPAGLVCAGVACVQSLTIAAPTVEPCQLMAGDSVPLPEPSWGEIARECRITASDTCPIEGYVCAPTPPEGFALCVHFKGDDPLLTCPNDYPDRRVVYAGRIDTRNCSPCACGEAQGDCAALVSVFSGGTCGALLGSHLVTTATEDTCFDLPPGVALGSKSAGWVVDEPGSCAPSGGEPLGEIEPAGPMTYCCQPQELPR